MTYPTNEMMTAPRPPVRTVRWCSSHRSAFQNATWRGLTSRRRGADLRVRPDWRQPPALRSASWRKSHPGRARRCRFFATGHDLQGRVGLAQSGRTRDQHHVLARSQPRQVGRFGRQTDADEAHRTVFNRRERRRSSFHWWSKSLFGLRSAGQLGLESLKSALPWMYSLIQAVKVCGRGNRVPGPGRNGYHARCTVA